MWKCSWKPQATSLKEKCHLHQLSSGVKFIQTCWSWHWITFSHLTMQTKGNNSTFSNKELTDPSLSVFSVLVGDQKTTPPPVSTLCALSEPPAILVSFITGSDGSAVTSGVPPVQELGLSPPKGQWCCPEASSPEHILLLCGQPIVIYSSNVKCAMHFFMSKMRESCLGQNWRLELLVSQSDVFYRSNGG